MAAPFSECLGAEQRVEEIDGEQGSDAAAQDEVECHGWLLETFAEKRVGEQTGKKAKAESNENEIGHEELLWSLRNKAEPD
jgi:hypothetical protein